MDNDVVTAREAYSVIIKILDHIEYDEEKHYKACSAEERRNHIYLARKYLEVFTVRNGAIGCSTPTPISTTPATEE